MNGIFDKLEKEKGSSLTNTEKSNVLKLLDIPKNDEGYYLDAFGNSCSYNGIRTLKKSYTKLPLTQDHLTEIEKCSEDLFYFVRNYCRILTKEGITFPEFRQYQIDFLEILSRGRDVVSSLPRQCIAGETEIIIDGIDLDENYKIIDADIEQSIEKVFDSYTSINELLDEKDGKIELKNNNPEFIKSYYFKEKIKTDNGFIEASEIHKTIKYDIYEIELENGLKLRASEKHVVIDKDYNEIYIKDCLGKELITKDGISKVISKKFIRNDHCYDITLSKHHLYYTNGILSHNSGKSVTTALYLLWKALFTKDINIGICANKLSLATEVLDKIKKIFVELPIWLQQGLEAWNKTYIVFENGTRIMTSAGDSDAFRGYSIHIMMIDECIEYNSKVTIRYRHLGIEQTLNIGDMHKRMNDRDFFIKELLKLEPKNEDLIIEYVDFCLLNNTESTKYETDMHHILPKSYFPEFKSDKRNLTCLTYRNHFLAHKLLALAFPHKPKIVFAFNAMKNKIQPFREKEDLDNTITEEEYEQIRKNVIVHLKDMNKGLVSARLKGEKSNFYKIPIEEFRQNRGKYETPSDGVFPVYDKELNKKVRISKEEYRTNKERYEIHTRKTTFIDPITKEKIVAEKKPDGENFFLHQNTQIAVLRDNKEIFIKVSKILEDDVFLYTKKEYQKIQKQKNIEERQRQLEEKRRERELHKVEERKNDKIIAYDKIENKSTQVSKEEFHNNPDRYEGIMKDTIDVIDLSTNKRTRIKKHLFDETKYRKILRSSKIFLVFNSSDELVFEGNSSETLDFLQNIDPSIKNGRKIYQAASYKDHQRLQQPKGIRGWRIRLK